MRKINKKGDVFITLWMISFILILGVIAFTFYLQNNEINKDPALGHSQISLINLSNQADKINN